MLRQLLLLATITAIPLEAAEVQEATGDLNLRQLQEAVRTSIKAKSVPLIAPSLGTQDETLMLRLGGPRRQYDGPRMPLDYPLEAQFAVELMRQQLAPITPGVDWDKTFRQAEEVIERELAHIAKFRDKPNELRQLLDKEQKEFIAVFEQALKQKAKGGKVSIVVPRAAARHKVTVKVAPTDGIAFYLPVLQYEIVKASGGLDDDRNWNEIAGATVRLGGNFHFRGRWSQNRTRVTGVIPITEDQVVTVPLVE